MLVQNTVESVPAPDGLQPPTIPQGVIESFAAASFGLHGKWSRLSGERDQNFLVTENNGRQWLFKLGNSHEGSAIFEAQALALKHIAHTDPSLNVPRVQHSTEGSPVASLVDGGTSYPVMVLTFIPGEMIGTQGLEGDQLFEIGALVASLGLSLRGFSHPAIVARKLLWDHRRFAELLPHVNLLDERVRNAAMEVGTRFCEEVLPRLPRLRSQIIHGDAHPFNMLVNDGAIGGIIDFGDMIFGALVQDLSNTIADYMRPGADNQEISFEIIRGYHSISPLEEEEVDVLLSLVESRILMNPLIQALRVAGGASASDYQREVARAFPLLSEIASSRLDFENNLRRAAGLPRKSSGTDQSVEEIIGRRRAVMGDRLYMFYDTPLHIVKGRGVWLTSSSGQKYLDAYNNVPHVGHCHPYVIRAIERQLRQLNTNTRYLTDQSIEYAERLTATLDSSLTTVIFVNSGSEANDIAWRMAKAWTGRSGGLCMDFAYHGITDSVDPFSPSNDMEHWNFPHMRVIPPPDDYRGPFKRGEANLAQKFADLADAPIGDLANSAYGVAAAMVDSAFMSNGMLDAPGGYLSAVVEKIRAAGGLFIADEVQSGFGRMGTAMWGHQHHGVVPDFVTIGKPAGNGHPIGVVITRPEIFDHFTKTAPFFSTFGGNNVSCAAGLAVLDVIRDEKLIENSQSTGAYFRERLLGLKKKYEVIGDVRGVGLAVGVELVKNRDRLEPAREEAKRLANLVRDQGVLVGTEGLLGNILKIRPPIAFQAKHVDIAIKALERAIRRL